MFLTNQDKNIAKTIQKELQRQQNQIELIASENFVSLAVMEAQGSILTNKYAEGYPKKRFYGGCMFIDEIENLACERLKKLFNCTYANVQPHSGSQANQAVFMTLMKPGNTFLSMNLNAGGHLTHGSKVNQSGKWFNAIHYGVNINSHRIDYNEIEYLAKKYKPKLIIAGGSAYPRTINFANFRTIADKINAYLMVDMAHFAGLVVGKVFNNPLPYAHIITSTTHKTLRGPRGGIIITNDINLGKKINSSVFPGIQGGPFAHTIAAKAVSFKEALSNSYKKYIKLVVKNAQVLSKELQKNDIDIITKGTDCHLILINLKSLKINGKEAEIALENAGITCNKNSIPFDNLNPDKTSGIRIGTPAMTTRGFKTKEFKQVAKWITLILKQLTSRNLKKISSEIRNQVYYLCKQFPLYKDIKY